MIANIAELAHTLDIRTVSVEHGHFLGLATELLVASDDQVVHCTRLRAF
jgi:hypothetical protein